MPFGRPCAHWAPRLLSSLAGLARIMGHPRVFGVWQTVRGSQGTCIPMLFGGPCAHWAHRLLFGLACRTWNLRQGRCAKPCAGTVQLCQFGALCPCEAIGSPRFLGIWPKRLSKRLRTQVYNICSTFARYNVSTSARCTDSFIC